MSTFEVMQVELVCSSFLKKIFSNISFNLISIISNCSRYSLYENIISLISIQLISILGGVVILSSRINCKVKLTLCCLKHWVGDVTLGWWRWVGDVMVLFSHTSSPQSHVFICFSHVPSVLFQTVPTRVSCLSLLIYISYRRAFCYSTSPTKLGTRSHQRKFNQNLSVSIKHSFF